MDKNHRLDAPNDNELRSIEQLGSHSGLTTIYPHAHELWEGNELMSETARESKRAAEQLAINRSVRKWFIPVGILIPLPFVTAALISAVGSTYITVQSLGLLLLPVIFTLAIGAYIVYASIKKVLNIFYAHSIKGLPFYITHLSLMMLSFQGHYAAIAPFYTNSIIYNTILTSGVVLITSIILSGVLLYIWTSTRLTGGMKFGCVGIIALLIIIATALVNLL